jgi:predicted GIY-YIG superfamily endonuclease
MLSFHVYILKCNDGSYYTGHTDDIEKRISEHHLGSIDTCYTKGRLPIEVVFTEAFGTRAEALDMERRIKGWSRKKKEALIKGDWNLLVQLSNQKK